MTNQFSDDVSPAALMSLGQSIIASTPPLFLRTSEDPELVSSSVLIKWQRSYFLVTAAHTLRRFNAKQLGVVVDHKFWTIGGWKMYTSSSTIEDDKIDIGVYKLSDEFIEAISARHTFIDLQAMDFSIKDSENNNYLVAGHSISRTKVNPRKHRIEFNPFLLLTGLSQDRTLHANTITRKDINLLLSYQRSDLKNLNPAQPVHGPDPRGISGCGVWLLSKSQNSEELSFAFAGVIIEYFDEYHLLIGTRMNVVTEVLRQHYEPTIPMASGPQIRTWLH